MDNNLNKRTVRKEILFSQEEWEQILEKSKKTLLQPSIYIRKSALNKELKEALTLDEMQKIDRARRVSSNLLSNVNQISKLANTHGIIPLYNIIIALVKNLEKYFLSGSDWTYIDIPDNISDLETILKTADEKYQRLRNLASDLYNFTYDGEVDFKNKYKCSIYPNIQKTKYYFRVENSNKSAVEIPKKILEDYKARKISIKNLYNYWENHN